MDDTNIAVRIQQLNGYISNNATIITIMQSGKTPTNTAQVGTGLPGCRGVTSKGKKETQDYQDAVNASEKSAVSTKRTIAVVAASFNPFLTYREWREIYIYWETLVQQELQSNLVARRDALQKQYNQTTNQQKAVSPTPATANSTKTANTTSTPPSSNTTPTEAPETK